MMARKSIQSERNVPKIDKASNSMAQYGDPKQESINSRMSKSLNEQKFSSIE